MRIRSFYNQTEQRARFDFMFLGSSEVFSRIFSLGDLFLVSYCGTVLDRFEGMLLPLTARYGGEVASLIKRERGKGSKSECLAVYLLVCGFEDRSLRCVRSYLREDSLLVVIVMVQGQSGQIGRGALRNL